MRACAISRATISVPLRLRRVLIGYCERISRTLSIPSSRSISTAGDIAGACSGKKRAGFFSSCSIKIPSGVILALMLRSAEQLTPIATGQEAAWRGARITRTSCTRYLPPNCAPIPISWQILRTFSSHSRSRKQRPPSLPDVGSSSR